MCKGTWDQKYVQRKTKKQQQLRKKERKNAIDKNLRLGCVHYLLKHQQQQYIIQLMRLVLKY